MPKVKNPDLFIYIFYPWGLSFPGRSYLKITWWTLAMKSWLGDTQPLWRISLGGHLMLKLRVVEF